MSRPLNEPWCMNCGDIEDADGAVVAWDVDSDDGDRIAAYSQAFHDIEDPVAWRRAVDEMRESLHEATIHWIVEARGMICERSGSIDEDSTLLLAEVNACRVKGGLGPLPCVDPSCCPRCTGVFESFSAMQAHMASVHAPDGARYA